MRGAILKKAGVRIDNISPEINAVSQRSLDRNTQMAWELWANKTFSLKGDPRLGLESNEPWPD